MVAFLFPGMRAEEKQPYMGKQILSHQRVSTELME